MLDWFRRAKPSVPLAQLSYNVAYFVLPQFAFNDLTKLVAMCLATPTAAGPFFYVWAAQMEKVKPDAEDATRFRWVHSVFDDGRESFALQDPVPAPVDLSDMAIKQIIGGGAHFILAPHFSAIIRGAGGAEYFILGQAPMDGGTTRRCILPEGMNCNLGPGPVPTLAAFLDAVRQRTNERAGPGAT